MKKQFIAAILFLIHCHGAVWADVTQADADGGATFRNGSETQRLLPDTVWETPVYTITGAQPGPTVLIVGGVHGNEPAGHHAANQIRHWPIIRGKLVVIPRLNVPAIKKHNRFLPNVPAEERDLNRNFPRDELPHRTSGQVANAMWQFAQALKPDWVIDLHEGYEFHKSHNPPAGKKKSVGSSIIYFQDAGIDVLVERMLRTVNATVSEEDRKLVRISRGPVNGSFVRASVKRLGAQGMILETTFKAQPISLRTRQHRMMVSVLLQHLEMIERDCTDILSSPESGENFLAVGLFDGSGTSSNGRKNVIRTLDVTSTMVVNLLGPADLHAEVLNQFDVLVFPGGSGSRQAKAIGEAGADNVRDFVKRGGGYVGICAGAYLCSAHYTWSLNIIDTHVFTGSKEIEGLGKKQMWFRGGPANVKMRFTEEGKQLLGQISMVDCATIEVRYQNGPIVSRRHYPGLHPYTTLAFFRSEKTLYPPQRGTMIDTPAIVTAPFGRGRVVSIGPHPEATKGLEHVVSSLVQWSAGD